MTHTWLVFETKQAADAAQQKISDNIGCPIQNGGYVMEKWARVLPSTDDKWAFLKPEDEYMTDVTGHTETTTKPEWDEEEIIANGY